MLLKIGSAVCVLVIGIISFILRGRHKKQEKKKHQAAFDILKEEALCNALTNPKSTGKKEENLYHLEDKIMLQLETKQAKKKLNYIFNPEKVITFGRNPKESDICLKDPLVSGKHCMIFVSQAEVWVKDVGSSNGTTIKRGRSLCRLEAEEALILKDKDQIMIGNLTFKVNLFRIDQQYL